MSTMSKKMNTPAHSSGLAVVPDLAGASAQDRILLTAHRLFYRDGVRATGVDRIIAESAVAKLTFYRHYPSKHDLILAYLAYRHTRWMTWFVDALARHGGTAQAIVPTLREWFTDETFRGCAFLNSVGELAEEIPEVTQITCDHKQDMAQAVMTLLPASRSRKSQAQALALAIDGAIVQAQFGQNVDAVLDSLARIVQALLAS